MNIRSKARLFATGTLLLIALGGLGLSKLLQRRTRTWPKTSATIRSAKMEIMELDGKTDVMLPCFTFSYFAAGESYSGRFSLLTDGQNEGESVAQNMMKRTIEIQYDPKRPSTWYIPDKSIGGYEVGQMLFPGRTPYPKD